MSTSRPGRFTPGEEPWYRLNGKLGGSRHFGEKKIYFACAGIRAPYRPVRSLVAIPTSTTCITPAYVGYTCSNVRLEYKQHFDGSCR
jgi:hypothetical protein